MTTQRLRSKPPAGASDNVTAVNKPVVFGTSESRPDLQCHVLFCVLISYWGIKFFESLTAWLICRFRLVWCYTPWIFWYSPMLFELHVTLQRERDRKKNTEYVKNEIPMICGFERQNEIVAVWRIQLNDFLFCEKCQRR